MLTPTVIEKNGIPAYIPELSVEHYHLLIREGVLPEGAPIELIDGQLVWKDRRDQAGSIMTVGPRHATTIGVIQQLLLKVLVDEEVAIRVQQPVTLSESEPEPDVSIVRGSLSDYMTRHPCQEDVLLCIEVSDSSLKYDRTTKLQVYARAGIPEYWIVNLNEEHVEVYRTPDPSAGTFLEDFIVPRESFLSLNIDDQSVELAISELLPC